MFGSSELHTFLQGDVPTTNLGQTQKSSPNTELSEFLKALDQLVSTPNTYTTAEAATLFDQYIDEIASESSYKPEDYEAEIVANASLVIMDKIIGHLESTYESPIHVFDNIPDKHIHNEIQGGLEVYLVLSVFADANPAQDESFNRIYTNLSGRTEPWTNDFSRSLGSRLSQMYDYALNLAKQMEAGYEITKDEIEVALRTYQKLLSIGNDGSFFQRINPDNLDRVYKSARDSAERNRPQTFKPDTPIVF
jgi:hypothetical protein